MTARFQQEKVDILEEKVDRLEAIVKSQQVVIDKMSTLLESHHNRIGNMSSAVGLLLERTKER